MIWFQHWNKNILNNKEKKWTKKKFFFILSIESNDKSIIDHLHHDHGHYHHHKRSADRIIIIIIIIDAITYTHIHKTIIYEIRKKIKSLKMPPLYHNHHLAILSMYKSEIWTFFFYFVIIIQSLNEWWCFSIFFLFRYIYVHLNANITTDDDDDGGWMFNEFLFCFILFVYI